MSEHLPVSPTVFDDNLMLADQLSENNTTYSEIIKPLSSMGGTTSAELRLLHDVAEAAITEPEYGPETNQKAIIGQLAVSIEQYTELYNQIAALEQDLQSLQEQLSKATADPLPERVILYANQVQEIVPTAKQHIETIIQSYQNPEITRIQQKINAIIEQLEVLYSLRDTASKAWPVPMAIYRYPYSQMVRVVDTYPSKPIQPTVSVRQCESKAKHEVMQGASLRLAELLIDKQGESLLPEQLGKILYQDVDFSGKPTVERELYYRDNVHRLLVPSAHRTNNILLEKGFTLQRGWRMYLTSDGTLVQQARRVYRVLPSPEANGETTYSEKILDSSELPMVISKPRNKRPAAPNTEQLSATENDKYELFRQDVQYAIETLSSNELLPPLDKIQSTIPVKKIQLNIFMKFGAKFKKYNKHIQSLYHHIINNNDDYDALGMVVGSLYSEWLCAKKAKSDKDYDTLVGIIELELIKYYESLAATTDG